MNTFLCSDPARLLSREAYEIYRACMYAPDFEAYKTKMRRYFADPAVSVYLCEEAGAAAGILVLRRSGAAGEILGIAVKEEMRRRGIGKEMIRFVCAAERLAEIIAETDEDAIGFYRKCGFSEERFEAQYPDGSALRYRCSLQRIDKR